MADEHTRVAVDGASFPVEIFQPTREGPTPAVVVLHELLGLNDDIRRICRRFRDAGYLVAVPDLANGHHWSCLVSTILQVRRGRGPAITLVVELVRLLRARDDVAGVAAAGFCLGGGFALLLGTLGHLDVTATFYGDIRPPAELAKSCPVVGGYGNRDLLFRGKGRALVRDLEALEIPHDITIYPDCGHSYMREDPERFSPLLRVGYAPGPAEDSWSRMLEFFDRHLG